MQDTRWTNFTLCADYNVDMRSLYMAWATPAGLEKWFLRKGDFFSILLRQRAGDEQIMKEDTYTWYWHGYHNDTVEKGSVLEANGHDLIRFTFSGDSVVTVKFSTRNGLTIIDLTQENIPEESDPAKNLFVQCQIGWTFYLANLKSVIEGGKDLRNKRVDLVSCFK